MTLSPKLYDVLLTLRCPLCDHPIIEKGSWFKSLATLKCAACGYAKQLGYADKLTLFDKHAHLHKVWHALRAETRHRDLRCVSCPE